MSDETTIAPDLESMPTMGVDPNDPEVYLKDSKGLKSGRYDRKNIEGLVRAARVVGVNPYQLVALSLQETGLGKQTGRRGGLASAFDTDEAQFKELADLSSKYTDIDAKYLKPAILLRDKIAYGKKLGFTDEPSLLQAYNGYGTITPDSFGGATMAYGVDISKGVNLRNNPLYGKRLVQLKNDLMQNEFIQSLLK